MDHAELRDYARKLQVVIDEGKLDRFREVLMQRTSFTGGTHDGTRYHELRPAKAREADGEFQRAKAAGLIDVFYPIIPALIELLGVPRSQAEAVAHELHVDGRRNAAMQLIDEAYAKLTRKPRRAS
jgi:hypothetical protein